MPPPQLGAQLLAHRIIEDPKVVEELNSLHSPGYRLTRESTSLAEKLLFLDEPKNSVLGLFTLGEEPALGLAGFQLGFALRVLSRKDALIINAISTHPSLDDAFGPAPGPGLTDILQSEADWKTVLCPTKVPGLAFLPFGNQNDYSPTSMTTKSLTRLFEQVSSTYPLVILIGPALNSEEAASLLLSADRIGGIAWKGSTTTDDVEALDSTCRSIEKPFLGIILAHG